MLKLAAIALAYATGVNAFSAEVRQNVRSNFGRDRMIALPISEMTDAVYEILTESGADDIGRQDGAMHFKLSPSAVAQLDIEGVSFADLTEEFISAMEENLNSENFVCTDGVEECASRSINDFHSSYQEYDTIHARFEALAAANPGLTDLSTLGLSHEGREQKLLLIGDQTKPLVYYFCTVHAREWIVPMYCTWMAETLLDSSNPESQDLLSRFSFAITPIGNPDGYIYSMEVNNAWRKTRKPNPSNSRCPGTDGNRNWGTGWGGPGSSGNTCSDTYRGTAPFDNPEIDNIRAFVDANKNRIIHVTDVHSYGEYWLAPYGGFTQLPPDKAKHDQVNAAVYDAILATTGLRFKTGPAANVLYVAAGVSQDYLYEAAGITHTYLYEARGGGRSGIAGFQPPTQNIMPSNLEMYAGMVAALGVIEAQEIRGIVPEPISLPEENTPQEPTEESEDEVSSEATDLSPLVGAIVFLGMVVAVMGALLGFVVFKFQNQQQKKEVKATHYELQ